MLRLWVTQEQIERARSIDLLSYLKDNEADNLIRIGNNTYCTKEHDSLKISNGLWHWFSRNIGGKTALDYLIKVRGYSFTDAVSKLSATSAPLVQKLTGHDEPEIKELKIPKQNKDFRRVKQYLLNRGIDEKLIDLCIEKGLLIEDEKYHNCVFLGMDEKGIPRYGAVRSTVSDLKREFEGSDKRFSFRILAEGKADTVHLFESAIDLLSYISLRMLRRREWENEDYLSLGGVYEVKDGRANMPIALQSYLESNQNAKTIAFHLDNDKIGRTATRQIMNALYEQYDLIDDPPKSGKDYNDYLNKEKEKRRELTR